MMMPDVECVKIVVEILDSLDIGNFTIKVGLNTRVFMPGVCACTVTHGCGMCLRSATIVVIQQYVDFFLPLHQQDVKV